MIPYGRQTISEEDVEAVVRVLRSEYLTQGPLVPKFEDMVSSFVGAQYGVAVNSATSALHLACLALNVGHGDWVWTSPNTFVASSNAALYCGAKVDFVDIDPRTYNMSAEKLHEKLVKAENSGNLPKVVIPVHYAGQPCDMHAINALASKFGFRVIEDASHAIGASYWEHCKMQGAAKGGNRISVGSCFHSDITVFSFHPVKIITSCEGGMALTNNADLAAQMRRLRSHGTTTEKVHFSDRPTDEIWNYQQTELGFNYRMSDIHAALGIAQLGRLETFVAKRNEIANRYQNAFEDAPLTTPFQSKNCESSYHLYPVRLNASKNCQSQAAVYQGLREAGVAANLHYIPVYRHPYYERLGFEKGYCPEAERYHREAISLPIFPSLSGPQQEKVVNLVHKLIA